MTADPVPIPFGSVAERLRAAELPDPAEVDAVVAIGRGGAVAGALVAFALDRPLRLLRLGFRDDANAPVRAAPEPVGAVPDVRGQRIVLVDDVTVSGASLRRARELLHAARITTLVVKGRPGAADVVLFPDVPECVRWPWLEDVPPAAPERPRAVIVAGPSGSGKTSVGAALAARLGWAYVEADDHHGAHNKAKMARGEPLDDADRAPWLASLRTAMDASLAAGRSVVLSCSALKRRYRETLTSGRPEAVVVLLHAPEHVLAGRLRGRAGHFFDPALLRSQIAALELPDGDEDVHVVDATAPLADVADAILDLLGLVGRDETRSDATGGGP